MNRPWTVVAGCVLSLAIATYDIVSALLDVQLMQTPGFIALLLVLSLVPVLFTVAAFFRKNWGRIALAVLAVLTFIALPLLTWIADAELGEIDAVTVLYAAADVAVIVLLFMPASNTWYRPARVEQT